MELNEDQTKVSSSTCLLLRKLLPLSSLSLSLSLFKEIYVFIATTLNSKVYSYSLSLSLSLSLCVWCHKSFIVLLCFFEFDGRPASSSLFSFTLLNERKVSLDHAEQHCFDTLKKKEHR